MVGGSANCLASLCTHPLDVMKVRMQVNADGVRLSKKPNIFKMISTIVRNEGILSFSRGLSASMFRQMVYSSLIYALYPVLKSKFANNEEFLSLKKKIYASTIASIVGSAVGSPTDLVLIRMQAGNKLNYRSIFHGLYRVARDEGIWGLFRGAKPTVLRGTVVNVCQLVAYDQIKQMMITKTNIFKDDLYTYLLASSLSGFISGFLSSPFDVVKTRIINMKPNSIGELPYTGIIDAFIKILSNEGIYGFYKGFIPNCSRFIPITILTFTFYEKLYLGYVRFFHRDVYENWKYKKV